MKWTAPSLDQLTFTIDLGDNNWFGGSEMFVQSWPLQKVSFAETPFVPNSNGGVLERYFLSSARYAYYIDETVPLFVSLDAATLNKTLNLKATFAEPYRNTDGRELQLNYYVVVGTDLLDVHKNCIDHFFGYPTDIPSEKVFRQPIWSTWDVYNKPVNQTDVLRFVQEIIDHDFLIGQVEIDDNWETCYGDETFDPDKFPNPIGMVNSLRLRGIDATLWVHPFVNVNCQTFQEGNSLNYLVTTYPANTTGITQWWNGDAGVIDVTKPEAAQWWAQRLNKLRDEIGIASFKFDAGETQYLPANGSYNSSENLQPGIFCTDYVTFASKYGGQVEVRDGYRSQRLPLLVRILDRDSVWSEVNGLRSVITSSLHLGIVGYPFVLPDMIAGNGFGIHPSDELFIRWVQVNAFLPVMQFSFTPWSFSEDVISISRKMVELHQNISDVLISAARQSTQDGSPIIRPLWWLSPNDTVAQSIDDEFLVGNKYLVAPVVTQGATERDIYLPEGKWKDENLQSNIVGPTWLKSYRVTLEEIPYFSKI